MDKTFDCDGYIICHNGADVIHASAVHCDCCLSTGQPFVEEFEDEDAWKARLVELGADPEQFTLKEPELPAAPETPEALEVQRLSNPKAAAVRAKRLAFEASRG